MEMLPKNIAQKYNLIGPVKFIDPKIGMVDLRKIKTIKEADKIYRATGAKYLKPIDKNQKKAEK